MVPDALAALLGLVEALGPAFTGPGLRNAVVIFAGWVLTNGQHAVTQALVATGVAGRRHHEAFHRFFSRGAWRPDDLGRLLFDRLDRLLPGTALRVVIDDTLAVKKGPHVFGLGCHIDAVRSTKALRVFAFGHVWVTLAVIVTVPFSKRPWALPVLFRLYRNKKECIAKRDAYDKKTELAREMLDVFATWTEGRDVAVAMDSAYCNDTVLRDLPTRLQVVGAMRPDAVLTTCPAPSLAGRAGRPRVRGAPLPKPEAVARCAQIPWQTCSAFLYGQQKLVYYKTFCAQWYRACGGRLLRIVIVRVDTGRIPFRVFFSTNPDLTVIQILEFYAGRWSIEVCFRDMKQLLGFADSSARKRAAVERTAPFAGYIYTALVIWFLDGIHATSLASPPLRPWYCHKVGFCFADILRAAQRTLAPLDVLDPAHSIDNLQKLSVERAASPSPKLKRAA